MKNTIKGLLGLAITGMGCSTPVAIAGPSSANPGRSYDLDIDRLPVSDALNALSQQTGLQISYFKNDRNQDESVGPLAGHFTADEAMKRLLDPIGLSFRQPNERTVVVVRLGAAPTRVTSEEPRRQTFLRVKARATEASGNAEIPPGTRLGKDLEEVVVTAQRREEVLQDVPIAIAVLGGVDLDKATGRGLNDELTRTPGVSFVETAQTGGSQLNIRGVGVSYGIFFGSSPIAFYVDAMPFGFVRSAVIPNLSPYDLERVEVLRGPQGTLYGASAQNGVIRVLTKDADLSTTEVKVRGQTSTTQWGGMNYGADAAFNVPIVQDKLATRLVVSYQDDSGWIDRPGKKDANDAERLSVRLKTNAQPTQDLAVGFSAWTSRSDFGGPNASTFARRGRVVVSEPISVDSTAFNLKAEYSLAPVTLTSATSYIDYSVDSRREAPSRPFPELPLPYPGNNVLTTNLGARVLAEEVALNSGHEGAWKWSLGAIYRDATETSFQVRRNPITGGFGGLYYAPAHADDTSRSWAVFGEVTRLFWQGRVELTAGWRYFEDQVTLKEKSRLTVTGGIPPTGLINSERTYDATSPRFVLTWHASDQITTYLSYGEGFRSGFQQTATILAADPNFQPAKPDTLINYEAGLKGKLFEGSLSFDAAAYYMDWNDVQIPKVVNVFGTIFPATVNGASASGAGIDINVGAQVTSDLRVAMNYSRNNLTLDEPVLSSQNQVIYEKGDRLSLSPESTAGASLEYGFGLGSTRLGGKLLIAGNYTSARYSRMFARVAENVETRSKPLFQGRAALSVDADDQWTATLYVDNFTNEQDPIWKDPGISAGGDPEQTPRLRPRTVGVQLEYRFAGK